MKVAHNMSEDSEDALPVYNPNNGKYRKAVWSLILEKECFYCGKETNLKDRTRDHIIPKWDGGRTIIENMVMACGACNRNKGNKTVWYFIDHHINKKRRDILIPKLKAKLKANTDPYKRCWLSWR